MIIKIIGMFIITGIFIRVLYVEIENYKKDKLINNLIRVLVVSIIFGICTINLIFKIYEYIYRI